MGNTLITLSDPKSRANLFKRIAALSASIPFLIFFVVYAYYFGISSLFNSPRSYQTITLVLIILYYGIFRAKIYEKCYLVFNGDKINGVFKVANQNIKSLEDTLLDPVFQNISINSGQINCIEIKILEIIITMKDGTYFNIDLQNFNYDQIKKLKECFNNFIEENNINR
jgi:hypothetical protein